MCEVLRLDRIDNTPWGFRLTGGYDFGTPLSVIKVTGGSIAAHSGVKVGDIVLEINGQITKNFIHKDAQNFIGISGNHLTLTVIRGSLVTPPDVTPSRGRTPMFTEEDNELNQNPFNGHLLVDRLQSAVMNNEDELVDGLKEPPIIHENRGLKADVNKDHGKPEGEMLIADVTDTELDEVLTGNEEVLDEGILGINFKKFLPQVDFIRESEVFKFLQNENTKKEISEEAQLQKEPTKRFSTFLQKPKAPLPKPQGPLWHYPKAPRYLPKESQKDPEQPHRRPKRESCHTVLWLFLGESGDQVVDERWGNDEEERINLSRCEMREEDSMSVTSSITTEKSGRESHVDKHDETESVTNSSECNSEYKTKTNSYQNNENHVETTINCVENQHREIEYVETENFIQEEEFTKIALSSEAHKKEVTNNQRNIECIYKQEEADVFTKQLADIQAQIAALEIQAPSDLQTQLLAIQEQLSKIGEIKTSNVISEHSSQIDGLFERKEKYRDQNTILEEEEKCTAELSKNYNEYTFECEFKLNGYKDYSDSSCNRCSPVENHESDNNREEGPESGNDVEEANPDFQINGDSITSYQKGEYELCETVQSPSEQIKKVPAHPITPQMRPIVLPGGRMWRQPKDACHDDFYQGVLVAQADVMIGNTGQVNFTKYVPPKFDMSHSSVYKLVHEIEDKTRALNEIGKENDFYNTPIGKRHFYAATLREPDPIGGVDVSLN